MVIVVVKSSFALSLGLVGALSIVRFRTPIKEPEELVYLFLAIAIGLGFGAGYSLITGLLSILTLAMIYFALSNRENSNVEYNLIVTWKSNQIGYDKIFSPISEHASSLKLVRYEHSEQNSNSIFSLEIKKDSSLDALTKSLKKLDEDISITFDEVESELVGRQQIMILIIKKHSFSLLLFFIVSFLIISSSLLIYDGSLIQKTTHNIRQKIMTYDTGFSSMKTILGRNAAIQAKDLIPEIPAILPGHIAKFISLKKSGFSSRNPMPTIEIQIPFKNYKKILSDRQNLFNSKIIATKVGAEVIKNIKQL